MCWRRFIRCCSSAASRTTFVPTTQDGKPIGGNTISRGNIYTMLRNPVYIGQVVHKGTVHPGLHDPIIDQDTWDQVQQTLKENRSGHTQRLRSKEPSLLARLVFDDAGGRLTPSHTNKRGARYRYYVSKSRLYGRPNGDVQDKQWRVPGRELEGAVLSALADLFTDHNELSALLSLGRLPPSEADAVYGTASFLAGELTSEAPAVLRNILSPLVRRVEIADASLTVVVALDGLRQALGLAKSEEYDAVAHTMVVPVRIAKRGVEQRLIVGVTKQASEPDATLVKAVAHAHAWVEQLKSGAARDLTEIAERTGLPPAYVRAHLPLAFLAPSIVAAIVEGRQPVDVTAKRLIYQLNLPISWTDQERVLGFSA